MLLLTRDRWRLVLGAAAAVVVVVVVVDFRDGVLCLQHIAVWSGGRGAWQQYKISKCDEKLCSRASLGSKNHVLRWLCGGREWVRGFSRVFSLRRSDLVRSTCDVKWLLM